MKANASGPAAAAKAKAKGRAKAKAAAVNITQGVTLGCGKCGKSRLWGYATCRAATGMTFDLETDTWN